MNTVKLIGWIVLIIGIVLFIWNAIMVIRPMAVGSDKPPLLVGDIYLILSVVLMVIGLLAVWRSGRSGKRGQPATKA